MIHLWQTHDCSIDDVHTDRVYFGLINILKMYAIVSDTENVIGSTGSIPRIATDQATSPEQLAPIESINNDLSHVKNQNATLTQRIQELENQLQASTLNHKRLI